MLDGAALGVALRVGPEQARSSVRRGRALDVDDGAVHVHLHQGNKHQLWNLWSYPRRVATNLAVSD